MLDRPNPAGRAIEGRRLVKGKRGFVGVIPVPQRHGLTLGELARYMVDHFALDVSLHVVAMDGYSPDAGPGFGWPEEGVWVNPSPAITGINCVRCYTGTVLLEGTQSVRRPWHHHAVGGDWRAEISGGRRARPDEGHGP